ncbi:membrane protein [Pseudoclavibacter endophyticus]|uniref:DUF485 domain-containing protein n=1 Tax=Pseudoclavibacter endophyticus TaxID=1778590 RepID=A0A6H9WFH8_9MICO|nr:DUF485 domain-containing protein [Pseudoclavibacter endophyticus]KAB1646888.1 DUF485 domain-containing protein [Pseudoclavibacter endophyticus]GGA74684.1 membrane protein [Pseudoclavibacter endophyticus]
MTNSSPDSATTGVIDYVAEEDTPRFRGLKRVHRGFVFPLSIFFLLWYFVYVVLAGWAPEFMATEVFGHVTIGLLLGLGQFVTTFVITMWYVRFANRRLDPIASEIRADLEAKEASR